MSGDAPGRALDEGETVVKAGLAPECPDCMATLVFEEGCVKCLACGYSEC